MFWSRKRKREAMVDNHIAQLAYAYVRELTHPHRDGIMVRHTEQDLVNAIEHISYQNRGRLSRMRE
jgi:hypothetical protein